jgi:hypothetical protein
MTSLTKIAATSLFIRFLTAILITFAICSAPLLGQTRIKQSVSNPVDALTSAPSLVAYSSDGAADATVTDDPRPEVKAIVNLGTAAIPLLISHLDDPRPTSATFNGKPVGLGHICLDILTNIVDAPLIVAEDCADDGLGACVDTQYYFRPDAFTRNGRVIATSPEVALVKARWQRAYRRGKVKFRYPDWSK